MTQLITDHGKPLEAMEKKSAAFKKLLFLKGATEVIEWLNANHPDISEKITMLSENVFDLVEAANSEELKSALFELLDAYNQAMKLYIRDVIS